MRMLPTGIAPIWLLAVAGLLASCSKPPEQASCSKPPEQYGPVKFKSIGIYSVYAIEEPGDAARTLRSEEDNPTGIGGTISVPRCYRWGVVLMANFELDRVLSDMNQTSCPELLVYAWDNEKAFSESDLRKIKEVKSLRRLDLQLCKGLSEASIQELAGLSGLEELLLPEAAGISNNGINAIANKHASLRIARGKAPSGQTVGQRIDVALREGRPLSESHNAL